MLSRCCANGHTGLYPQACCMHLRMHIGGWACCTVSHDHITHYQSLLHANVEMQEMLRTNSGQASLPGTIPAHQEPLQCAIVIITSSSCVTCYDSVCVHAGGDILEGMPPGQVKVARKMLQDLHIKIVTNAMVGYMHHQQSVKTAWQLLAHCRPGPTLRMSIFNCAWCTCFVSPSCLASDWMDLSPLLACNPCLLVQYRHVRLLRHGKSCMQQMLVMRINAEAQQMICAACTTVHVSHMQVSSIRQEHHQPSTAKTSTSQRVHPAAAAAAKQQVHIKLPSNSKSTVHADMVLWTAGSSPASHAARKLKLPFKTNKQGALLTDRNLRVVQQQRVFALGDVAGSEVEAQTANIPPTAQVYMGVLHCYYSCGSVALPLVCHCCIATSACGCFC